MYKKVDLKYLNGGVTLEDIGTQVEVSIDGKDVILEISSFDNKENDCEKCYFLKRNFPSCPEVECWVNVKDRRDYSKDAEDFIFKEVKNV